MKQKIILVDDDIDLSKAIKFGLDVINAEFVWLENKIQFEKYLTNSDENIKMARCLIMDINLGNDNGLDLFQNNQSELEKNFIKVLFLTGHGEIDEAVGALKKGALDFLQKPIDFNLLIESVKNCLKASETSILNRKLISDFEKRFQNLTDKEKTIMKQIIISKSNKEIALELGNSIRTIELHRSRIFEKMSVENAIDLARENDQYQNLSKNENILKNE